MSVGKGWWGLNLRPKEGEGRHWDHPFGKRPKSKIPINQHNKRDIIVDFISSTWHFLFDLNIFNDIL